MNSKAEADPVATLLLLGQAWLARGKSQAAAGHLGEALRRAPDNPDVHRHWAYLKLFAGDFAAAAEHMAMAARQAPADGLLERESTLLGELAGLPPPPADLPAATGGRLRFPGRYLRDHHRSGWRPAMEAIYPLHHPKGIRFESFLDEIFAVEHPRPGIRSGPELLAALQRPRWSDRITSEERRVVPIREPWVGFLHNPYGMPPWFYADHAPEFVFTKSIWRDSLPSCVGLFTLSEHMAQWMRTATGKPVSVAYLPSEIPEITFDFEAFLANPEKRVIQIGWWLRRQTAIDHLPLPADNAHGYGKLRLVPGFASNAREQIEAMRTGEFERHGMPPAGAGSVEAVTHVSNDEYDRLLSRNIAFVHLEAANANNAVVECLARGTPLLVNRLPAVEEYLGRDYPLYYENLQDAADQAMDLGRLRAAHDYLLTCDHRDKLDPEVFRRSIEESEVYRQL
jgi:hypothetical protein